MRADLHVHSTASDGTRSPSELVTEALQIGLDVIAVTDHDSVEGVAPALEAAKETAVHVIPGVELSSSADGVDVHVLGYYVDHTDPDLTSALLALRHSRLERALSMVRSLTEAGIRLEMEDVLQLAAGGSVGRSHVARALVKEGHVVSVQDAFEHLIGAEGPHFIPKPLMPPEEAIRLIATSGGLPVLAHPGVNGTDELIPRLTEAGLRGVEAYHPDNAPDLTERLLTTAEDHDLVVTGGSDYHGPEGPGPGLGAVDIPADVPQRLRHAAGWA